MSAAPPEAIGPLAAALRARLRGQPLPLVRTPATACPGASLHTAGAVLAASLREASVAPGDRVAVDLPNGIGFVAALLACLRIGATFAPIAPGLERTEVARRIELLRPAAVLVPGDASAALPRILTRESGPTVADDIAVVLFTGARGAAGRAVAFSQHNLLHVATAHAVARRLRPGDRVTGFLSWARSFGFTLELLTALLSGCELLSVPPAAFPDVLRAQPGAEVVVVPAMLERLDAEAIAGLAGGLVVGTPVDGHARALLEQSPLRVAYGLTECSAAATLGEPGECPVDGWLGSPLGCEVRVQPARGSQAGELTIAGAGVALGYLAEAGLACLPVRDGRLRSGDLAAEIGGGFAHRGRVAASAEIGRSGRPCGPAHPAENDESRDPEQQAGFRL